MVAIREALIDDVTWEAAGPERRREVLVAIDDLLAEHQFDVPALEGHAGEDGAAQAGEAPLRLLITDTAERTTLDPAGPAGTLVAQATITAADLEDHVREYLATCRDLVTLGSNSPRLEALDIAKRLIHDEAAETLQARCRLLRPSHPTARRLFTLLLTIRHDTTSL